MTLDLLLLELPLLVRVAEVSLVIVVVAVVFPHVAFDAPVNAAADDADDVDDDVVDAVDASVDDVDDAAVAVVAAVADAVSDSDFAIAVDSEDKCCCDCCGCQKHV